jgi:hypothetical protein
MKPLPIGIQSFRKLREGDFLYVDKTEYIHRLLRGSGIYFLSRPRRFGKSLLLSTLKEVFQGNRALFRGLWIEDKIDWKPYPVMHLSFDKISSKSTGTALLLEEELDAVASGYGLKLIRTGIKGKTSELISKLAGDTGVVILIDEYDKPILDAVPDNIELAHSRREVLKEFFETLKSEDAHIRFLLITGISKFSRMSVFSGMNNLQDLTLHERYAAICGYTQEELEAYFAEAFPDIATQQQLPEPALLPELRQWYNGYNWGGDLRVYNPWSILNLVDKRQIKNYWFSSGHPEFLLKILKKGLFYQLTDLTVNEILLDSFELENIDYRALLFQTGYLTIGTADPVLHTYTLRYPNREIEESLLQYMLAAYSETRIGDTGLTALHLREALQTGDLNRVVAILNSLFASIPHQIFLPQYEAYFHSILHIAFTLLGFYVQSEPSTAAGRADAVVTLPDRVYIFEFKINGTAQEALAQIESRDYAGPYRASGKTVIPVGVGLSVEEKGISAWVAGA